MGKITVIPRRDPEFPNEEQGQAKDKGGPIHPRKKSPQAAEMDQKERDRVIKVLPADAAHVCWVV
jgi:hypothetical protein